MPAGLVPTACTVIGRDERTGRAPQLPRIVRTADALTVGLVILTAFIALYPTQFIVLGIPIRMRRWPRVMSLAVIVAIGRHWWVYTPSLWSRIVDGCGRLLQSAGTRLATHVPLVLAVGLPSLLNLAIVLHGYDGVTYMRGDCTYYYWTATALLEGHGLYIGSQLPGGWEKHINQVSLSIDNRAVPKHPVVMPILSLPFIAAFGKVGALIFNLVQVTILLWLLYRLASSVVQPFAATAAVVVTFLGSALPHYVWNYSPDMCATVLLVGGTLLVSAGPRTRDSICGGVLLGAACVAKLPLIVFLPGSLLLLRKPFWKPAVAVSAGIAIPLVAFALMNIHLFGSPFVTSYDRIATLDPGNVPAVYSQRSSFGLPIGEGARAQLFESEHGLLTTSPVTLLALLGVPALFVRYPRLAAHVVGGSVVLFLVYSTYDQWNASHYGNRFLMPVMAAFTVPLAAMFDQIARRWTGARRPRVI